jgi:hypothetical protein
MSAFGRIEKNPALVVTERNLNVIIPVAAIPKGYNWDRSRDVSTAHPSKPHAAVV